MRSALQSQFLGKDFRNALIHARSTIVTIHLQNMAENTIRHRVAELQIRYFTIRSGLISLTRIMYEIHFALPRLLNNYCFQLLCAYLKPIPP